MSRTGRRRVSPRRGHFWLRKAPSRAFDAAASADASTLNAAAFFAAAGLQCDRRRGRLQRRIVDAAALDIAVTFQRGTQPPDAGFNTTGQERTWPRDGRGGNAKKLNNQIDAVQQGEGGPGVPGCQPEH